jgi:hypothetical protein
MKADSSLLMAHGSAAEIDHAKTILAAPSPSRLDVHVGAKGAQLPGNPVHATARLNWRGGPAVTTDAFQTSRRLTVSEVRLALPNFDNIAIRIANVAARLAVLVLWLCDKFGSSSSP